MVGSAATYATIKRVLEADSAKYKNREFNVFLQGSYGNDTNTYAESDVDIVICYYGAFYFDISPLSAESQVAFRASLAGPVSYSYESFKGHVEEALRSAFGESVKPGKKAIRIEADGARRSADVIVAFEFRRYYRFNSNDDCDYYSGISFFTSSGTRVDNFPKYHSDNATARHQEANQNYKPLIRIFKNMRRKLINDGVLNEQDAPSYFIEGLLYNVPTEKLTGPLSSMVFNTLKWLHDTPDRDAFVCVNKQHYLIRDNESVCWPKANCTKFINAAINLWNNWR